MGEEAPVDDIEGEEPVEDVEDIEGEDEFIRPSRRFMAGVVLIIVSLVLGKLVWIPLVVFPDSRPWRVFSIVGYLVTWLMLIPALPWAGVEGYRLAKQLYKEYRRRALIRVRDGGRVAARGAVKVAKAPVVVAPKVARGAVKVVKAPVAVAPKVARGAVNVVKKPLEALRKDGRDSGPDEGSDPST